MGPSHYFIRDKQRQANQQMLGGESRVSNSTNTEETEVVRSWKVKCIRKRITRAYSE